MQFYLDGYTLGDPTILDAATGRRTPGEALPETVDVLVVGTGPAGCVLAAQLAAFPEISTLVVERRNGPLDRGQADGVACRTVEMFQAFGLADVLLAEGYWVNEVTFWGPDPNGDNGIVRLGRIEDTPDGLSEMPHITVNQARLQELLLERMRKSATRLEPDYGFECMALTVDGNGDAVVGADRDLDHPVRVTLRKDGRDHEVRARYVVGCDGARSRVRQAIGLELRGDSANHAWGVLDLLAVTDYPDWRRKAIIQSPQGNLLIIPREGGYLVRVYADLGEVSDREAIRAITADQLVATAQRALAPYTLDVRDIAWFSVYEVGQRLTDKFDDVPAGQEQTRNPRVFIAGDACHTHSAKAGQGMNVSMQDTFNLGWKLISVLQGRSDASLLHTYSAERQAVAQDLIDFDKAWSSTISQRPFDSDHPELGGIDPAEVQAAFIRSGRYTAGLATQYTPSLLTMSAEHQGLAAGFPVGMRFHSSPVLRVADARELELGHIHDADGRWRLYVFADASATRANALLTALGDRLIPRFTPRGWPADGVLDVRAVYQQPHLELNPAALPPVLRPAKGGLDLLDYEKAFSCRTTRSPEIFDAREIDREQGALVVVRPDQYVAQVLPLDGIGELEASFSGILLGVV